MSETFLAACLRRKLDELVACRGRETMVQQLPLMPTLAVSATGCDESRSFQWEPGPLASNELIWLSPDGGRHASWPVDLPLDAREAELDSTPLAMHAEAAGESLCGVASASLDACACNHCWAFYKSGRGPFGENVLLVTVSGTVLASGDTWYKLGNGYEATRHA